jgi:predicted site-specific integrase-resolvase
MKHERYISASEVKKRYQISSSTLRRWADQGKIPVVRFNSVGKRLYASDAIETAIGGNPTREREKVAYARVSSLHQKEDLNRQITDLRNNFPGHRIISDIGSGINFKRKGMQTILELAMSEKLEEVVVMHRDRLARFGVELFETIFSKTGTRLVVFGKDSTDSQGELAEDLLAITTVFVARHNGARSATNRKRRKTEREASSGKDSQDSGISNSRAESQVNEVDGNVSMDVQPMCSVLKEQGVSGFEEGVTGSSSQQGSGGENRSMDIGNTIRCERRSNARCSESAEIQLRCEKDELHTEVSQSERCNSNDCCPLQTLESSERGIFGCVRK